MNTYFYTASSEELSRTSIPKSGIIRSESVTEATESVFHKFTSKGYTDPLRLSVSELEVDTSHGSPYDRGKSDRYYMRPRNPHKWIANESGVICVRQKLESEEEIASYNLGYLEEEGRKDWY